MNSVNRCKPLLGTYVEVNISGNYEDAILLKMSKDILSEIERIEALMSFYDDESELSYINSNAYYHSCSISNEMRDVLRQALKISALTDGYYDISIGSEMVKNGFLPNKYAESDTSANWKDVLLTGNKIKFQKRLQLDLGGIAKGYAVDQALLVVKDVDAEIAINAGGDLVMNNWLDKSVSVKSPLLKESKLIDVKMQNRAVATSASYYFDKCKSPIISPKSKKMINDNRSVSVFASSCMVADALTKVVFLCKDSASLLKTFDAQALFIDEKGVVY